MPPGRLEVGLLALVFAALAWAWPSLVRAGSPPARDELSLGWTPRVVLRRDQVASPRLYVGPAWGAAALRYARTRAANAHRLELDFARATLRSQPDFDYFNWPEGEPVRTEGSPLIYVRLRYAYLRRLPTPDRIALRLGPGLDFDVQQLDWVHHPLGLGGYLGAFALDARAELELRLAPRQRLRAGASIPLLAWVARSPYAITDDASIYAHRDHSGLRTFFRYLAGGGLVTWNRYQAARLELRHELRFAEHWALSTGLHLRVLALRDPRPVLAQEYGASLALTALF